MQKDTVGRICNDQSTFLVVNSSGCWSMAALFGIYICKQYFLILRICSFLIHKK